MRRLLDGLIGWSLPPLALLVAFLQASLLTGLLSGGFLILVLVALFFVNAALLGWLWHRFARPATKGRDRTG
ncbi:MAG: hypothetical protein JXQ91_14280 [Vannielia sp.]|uniref:hypothetical protein n=1 Tax=Rhodobacterales TaxID=204455 RepID=UPI002094C6B0|nr:hypothetical protein [Oceanicola sp. 502str15]MCO6383053.1 hypothetical protein [Oceanicola sp. 502str15]